MKDLRVFIICTLLLCCTVGAYAQKQKLAKQEIPDEILNYVKHNFGGFKILKATKEIDNNKTEYEIKLNKKISLEFDELYRITEIESKRGISIQFIPQIITDYVNRNYPNTKITEWKLNLLGQKIELDNDIEIQFDSMGSFIKIEY